MKILENGDRLPLEGESVAVRVHTKNLPVDTFCIAALFLNDQNESVFPPLFAATGEENEGFQLNLWLSKDHGATRIKVVFGEIVDSEASLSSLGLFDVFIGRDLYDGKPKESRFEVIDAGVFVDKYEFEKLAKINSFHDFYGNSLRIGSFLLIEDKWVFETSAGCSENTITDLINQHGGVASAS